MSQKTVEWIIGRLATDEESRQRFRAAPRDALDALAGGTDALTGVERDALSVLDPEVLDRFADELDSRLQRVRIPAGTSEGSDT